jgi:hypothetical protein
MTSMIPVSSPIMKEAVTMQINWLWLAVGFLPYSIKRQKTKNEQVVRIRALFWLLTIRWQQGQHSWEISFPWLENWRQ